MLKAREKLESPRRRVFSVIAQGGSVFIVVFLTLVYSGQYSKKWLAVSNGAEHKHTELLEIIMSLDKIIIQVSHFEAEFTV